MTRTGKKIRSAKKDMKIDVMSDHDLLITNVANQKASLEKLELIYGEVKKTNGRVSGLEEWKTKQQQWREDQEKLELSKTKIMESFVTDLGKCLEYVNKQKGGYKVILAIAFIADALIGYGLAIFFNH